MLCCAVGCGLSPTRSKSYASRGNNVGPILINLGVLCFTNLIYHFDRCWGLVFVNFGCLILEKLGSHFVQFGCSILGVLYYVNITAAGAVDREFFLYRPSQSSPRASQSSAIASQSFFYSTCVSTELHTNRGLGARVGRRIQDCTGEKKRGGPNTQLSWSTPAPYAGVLRTLAFQTIGPDLLFGKPGSEPPRADPDLHSLPVPPELSRDVFLTCSWTSPLKHLLLRAFLAGIPPTKLPKVGVLDERFMNK